MPHNLKDEVFKMMRKEDESFEDLVESFSYNIKRAKIKSSFVKIHQRLMDLPS